jgi:hypothetical protein
VRIPVFGQNGNETRQGQRPKVLSILFASSTLAGVGWLVLFAHAQIAVQNQGYVPYSDAPINYRSKDLYDPVAKLQRQLDEGKAKLQYEPHFGYLKSVLRLLRIPGDSQTLVFSKTSFQYKEISPEHPRALYYNDDVSRFPGSLIAAPI